MRNMKYLFLIPLFAFVTNSLGAVEKCPANPNDPGWEKVLCFGEKGAFTGAAITQRDQYYILCYFNNPDKTEYCAIEKGSKNKITPAPGSLWTQKDPTALYTCVDKNQDKCSFNVTTQGEG